MSGLSSPLHIRTLSLRGRFAAVYVVFIRRRPLHTADHLSGDALSASSAFEVGRERVLVSQAGHLGQSLSKKINMPLRAVEGVVNLVRDHLVVRQCVQEHELWARWHYLDHACSSGPLLLVLIGAGTFMQRNTNAANWYKLYIWHMPYVHKKKLSAKTPKSYLKNRIEKTATNILYLPSMHV